jgi:long-subunit fatty acid transport protein
MSVVRKLIILFVVVFAAGKVWGQAASTPFTTYGIGESYGNSLIHNQGMAGLGVAQPQMWYLNNTNPALLVFNTLTVFEIGAMGESRTIKGDTASSKTRGGNMSYLAIAFPIKTTKWTTSIGLMPATSVNYSYRYYDNFPDPEQTPKENIETGDGGLTQLYWSNGVRINKEMSIGLRAAYLFGPLDYTYSNQALKPNQVPYIITVEQKASVKGFNFGLGYSFSRDSLWGKNYRLNIGAVYDIQSSLNAKRDDSFYRLTTSGDTLENTQLNNKRGSVEIPGSITIGASINKGSNWSVGTEFMYQNWKNFKNINADREDLGTAWKFIVGGEFTPDPFALGNLLKRITYRAGASIEQYPWVTTQAVRDLGINFGLSVPAGRSSLDLAARFGKRGDKDTNQIEESYFKVYFGITFNDQWFIKRKFD